MNRRFLAGFVAVVLAGCSLGATPTSSPVIPATASPAADTPAPTVSRTPTASPAPTVAPEPTMDPEPTYGPCPTTAVLSVKQFVLADPECFTGRDIEIRGWLDYPEPLGFEGPVVEPRWLFYPTDEGAALWFDIPTTDFICDGDPLAPCYAIFPHRAPDRDLPLLPLKRWVVLTGHTHDPAAETCKYEDQSQPNAELVATCRIRFVVTAIRDAP